VRILSYRCLASLVILICLSGPALATPLVFTQDHFEFAGLSPYPQVVQLNLDLFGIDSTANSFRATVSGVVDQDLVLEDPGGGIPAGYTGSWIAGIVLEFFRFFEPFTDIQLIDTTAPFITSPGNYYGGVYMNAINLPVEPGLFSWSATYEITLDDLVGHDFRTTMHIVPGQCFIGDCDVSLGAHWFDGPSFSIKPIPEPRPAILFAIGALIVGTEVRRVARRPC